MAKIVLENEVKNLDFFDEDLTVQKALEIINARPRIASTLTINGKDAKKDDKIKENDLVVFTPRISNG